MFGITGKSKRKNEKQNMKEKECLKSDGVDEGKNGADRAITKFWLKDALERIKGLIST